MVAVARHGRRCFAIIDDTGEAVETRSTREHAAEVLFAIMAGLVPPTEAKQALRDGYDMVVPCGTSTVVTEHGRSPVKDFDTVHEARMWLSEYRRLCKAHRAVLDAADDTFDIQLQMCKVYKWVILKNGRWFASFRSKTQAHQFVFAEASG